MQHIYSGRAGRGTARCRRSGRAPVRRCRLSVSNDRETLVDDMAKGAWETAGYGGSWDDVGSTWHGPFRHHADLMLRVFERDHVAEHG